MDKKTIILFLLISSICYSQNWQLSKTFTVSGATGEFYQKHDTLLIPNGVDYATTGGSFYYKTASKFWAMSEDTALPPAAGLSSRFIFLGYKTNSNYVYRTDINSERTAKINLSTNYYSEITHPSSVDGVGIHNGQLQTQNDTLFVIRGTGNPGNTTVLRKYNESADTWIDPGNSLLGNVLTSIVVSNRMFILTGVGQGYAGPATFFMPDYPTYQDTSLSGHLYVREATGVVTLLGTINNTYWCNQMTYASYDTSIYFLMWGRSYFSNPGLYKYSINANTLIYVGLPTGYNKTVNMRVGGIAANNGVKKLYCSFQYDADTTRVWTYSTNGWVKLNPITISRNLQYLYFFSDTLYGSTMPKIYQTDYWVDNRTGGDGYIYTYYESGNLTITNPTTSILVYSGDTIHINYTWNKSALISKPFKLYYSGNSGSTWTYIDTNSVGTYTWTLPNILSAGVRLRITSTDSTLIANSPLDFTIISRNRSITILEPIPSLITFTSPGILRIRFISKGVDSVKINYTLGDSLSTIFPIIDNLHVVNSGLVDTTIYDWPVGSRQIIGKMFINVLSLPLLGGLITGNLLGPTYPYLPKDSLKYAGLRSYQPTAGCNLQWTNFLVYNNTVYTTSFNILGGGYSHNSTYAATSWYDYNTQKMIFKSYYVGNVNFWPGAYANPFSYLLTPDITYSLFIPANNSVPTSAKNIGMNTYRVTDYATEFLGGALISAGRWYWRYTVVGQHGTLPESSTQTFIQGIDDGGTFDIVMAIPPPFVNPNRPYITYSNIKTSVNPTPITGPCPTLEVLLHENLYTDIAGWRYTVKDTAIWVQNLINPSISFKYIKLDSFMVAQSGVKPGREVIAGTTLKLFVSNSMYREIADVPENYLTRVWAGTLYGYIKPGLGGTNLSYSPVVYTVSPLPPPVPASVASTSFNYPFTNLSNTYTRNHFRGIYPQALRTVMPKLRSN